jgi:hypothetical protein
LRTKEKEEFNPNPNCFLLVKFLTILAWFTSNKLGRISSKEKRWVELHMRWTREINLNQASTSSRDHEEAIPFHLPWRGRRFDGEEEERGREKEERRESKNQSKI